MTSGIEATDTMAYATAGGVPWHGMGVPVIGMQTPEEMCKIAQIDWKVYRRPLDIKGCKISKTKFSLTRGYDGDFEKGQEEPLDVCGTKYREIQNEEAFSVFKKFCDDGNMTMETAGSLKSGGFVWGLAKTANGFTLPGGDEIQGYLLLVNPHMVGYKFIVKMTPTRVVCWNTMSYALKQRGLAGEFRMRHDSEWTEDKANEIHAEMGLINETFEKYQEAAEVLSKKTFSEKDNVVFLQNVFAPTLIDKLVEENVDYPVSYEQVSNLPTEILSSRSTLKRVTGLITESPEKNFPGYYLESSKDTAWGAFNIVTRAYDHVLGNSIENRMGNTLFGTVEQSKQKALDLALEMAA